VGVATHPSGACLPSGRLAMTGRFGILFITSIIVISYSIAFAQEDSVKLLQKAYKRGEIDYQTALNYKLYAIFNKKKLPKAYQSHVPIKSATPIILEAKQNRHLLFKENEFILQRPTDSSDEDYYGDGITVWTYDSPSGNFKIHYTEDNTNGDAVFGSDGDQGTIPQYVIDLASYLDNSWTQIITNMGYTAPPSDGTAGGDCKVDVYLLDMGAYGYTDNETCSQSGCTVYLAIENDFVGSPENLDSDQRQGSQKVTAAHEFFHSSQFQYTTNISANGWWMEATATWMEDIIYPTVKDYLNYIGQKYDDANDNGQWNNGETYYKIDGVTVAGTTGRPKEWFDHPEYSLDSTQDYYEYGTIIWVKYLSKTYDNSIIKSIFQRICSSGATALTAISDELTARGTSLSSVFKDSHEANYKRDYPDGNYYPIIRHEATYTTDAYTLSVTPNNYLSAQFYAFKPPGSSSSLTLTFNNMNTGEIAVRLLLLQKTAGGYDKQDVNLNGSLVEVQISGYGSTYSKVIAIIVNTYSPLSYSAENNISQCGSGGGGDSDCFIATAVYGSYLSQEVQVLRKFRDEYISTNQLGRAFLHHYYKFSPPIADYIKRHEALKTMIRFILTPMVYGIKYPVFSLVVAFAFVSVIILIIHRIFISSS